MLAAACALAPGLMPVVAAAPAKKGATARKKAAPKAPAAMPRDLAGLVRVYREAPSAARRSAILSWAASHPKDAASAKLALGIAAWEQKDFSGAAAALRDLAARLPHVADYAAYYLGAAHLELGESSAAAAALAGVYAAPVTSPLRGKAWVAEARALIPQRPAAAVQLLAEHSAELPQPEGDLALGEAAQAAGDLLRAATSFQRVYYQYPDGDAATRAGAALETLRAGLGAAYPHPSPELVLRRGGRLVEMKEYTRARIEFQNAAARLSGTDRDRALARAAAVDLWRGQPRIALAGLRGLDLAESDADAERLYYVVESARRTSNEGAMMDALERIGRRYPQSPWRAQALLAAGNRFLVNNRPDQYVPLYRALYENFPGDAQAPFCHWKVAFAAHLAGNGDAARLLREHVRLYPSHSSAAAALYFLGRRAEREGDTGAARAWYTRLGEVYPNQYYGVLIRERLAEARLRDAVPSAETLGFLAGVPFPQRKRPAPDPTPDTSARLERSRLLRHAGLADLADGELRFGARNGAQPWVMAVEMASAADNSYLALRAMKALSGDYLNLPLDAAPRRFWELLFPLPWRAELIGSAGERSLDPYIVAGLVRQESEFNPKAVSRAKAYGLTQIRPPTGRLFARQVGIRRITVGVLTQPSVNLKLGTAILRSMLDRQGGQWERTLAAYNAGPNRVADWITWAQFGEPAEFVESIPFTETREYVQAVLRNADIYRRLYEGRNGGLRAAR